MPLFEYHCRDCGKRFEAFVTGSHRPVCPSCKSEDLEKLVSVFGVGGPAGSSAGSSADKGGCSSGGG
jgi:putative FmdB family regulatory protein